MADKPRFDGKVIDIVDARVAFFRGFEAHASTPTSKPKYSATYLLDPSRVDHAKTILEIKREAFRALQFLFGEDRAKWPVNAGGAPLFYCFGLGNDLPKLGSKIWDGYADMFYLKVSDLSRPSLRNRAGAVVAEGDPEVPYSGCYVNGKTTFFAYDNKAKGVSANFRSMQFVRDGKGFGGGARGAEDEYAALGDRPKETTGATEEDPFG